MIQQLLVEANAEPSAIKDSDYATEKLADVKQELNRQREVNKSIKQEQRKLLDVLQQKDRIIDAQTRLAKAVFIMCDRLNG